MPTPTEPQSDRGARGAGDSFGAVGSPRHSDVLVVGAGPAGTAAALTARRHGLHAEVVDRATFPRDKTCGDGLTAAAFRHLEALGLPRSALPGLTTVTEAVLVSPSGREVPLPLPGDGLFAGVVPRAELDHALVTHARASGVPVHEGSGLVDVTVGPDLVTATCADGSRHAARYLVAADGNYSTVRKILEPGAGPRFGTWHAFRQYFSGVDDPRLWVSFEADLLPGYAWVFPLPDGRANVGYGVLRTPGTTGRQLNALWHDVVTRPSMRRILGTARPEGSPRAWPIPGDLDGGALHDGRVLYVGDAAGAVDPMTGEGIAQALETGILAAEAVAGGGTAGAVGERYDTAVLGALQADARMAHGLQRLLAHPLLARAAVRAIGTSGWTRRNFARWMFEDYPRAVLVTPRRWHRGMFTGDGAYTD